MSKKKFKMPHTYVVLFAVILLAAVLTYIIPAGEYSRMEDPGTGRMVFDPDGYSTLDRNPATPWSLFEAIPKGMGAAQGIIFFIFIVGGAFGIVTATGAIEGGIARLALKVKDKGTILIPVLLTVFSIGGATFGLAEETLVFIPIGVALARALGFDAITGMAMVTMGASIGFSSGWMNPFTVGVAQGIAEVPLFSGMWLRFIVHACLLVVTSIYVIRYANKVKADPESSFCRELEIEEGGKGLDLKSLPEFTLRHKLVLGAVVIGLGFVVWGVMTQDWYIREIATTFLIMGIAAGFISGRGPSEVAKAFVEGAKGITFGALVVGIARAILVVLEDGLIIHTIINGLASAIQTLPAAITSLGMYVVQIVINFFIPSGSGQAMATMPIMSPLSDLVGVNRQVAVLAYQFGDGFTNSIIPTSGTLLACLSIAKINYDQWVKFNWKLIGLWIIVGSAFMIFANIINYGPF